MLFISADADRWSNRVDVQKQRLP